MQLKVILKTFLNIGESVWIVQWSTTQNFDPANEEKIGTKEPLCWLENRNNKSICDYLRNPQQNG